MAATAFAPQRTLREFLDAAALQWHARALQLADQARRARDVARELAAMRPRPGPVDDAFVRVCAGALAEECDPVFGGWGEAPKRVNAGALRLLAARPDIPGGREALERTLSAMRRRAIRDAGGGFSCASDTADWETPDGVERPAEMADLFFAYAAAADIMQRADFAETAQGIARRLDVLRDARGLSPVAATREDGGLHPATAESSYLAASVFRGRPGALDFAPAVRDAASGLCLRSPGAPPIFHLADQAAALVALASRAAPEAVGLAEAVVGAFWDEDASAFRDRCGLPLELAPLDTPLYPVDANATAAGALALLGGSFRDLARRCLASFTDAFYGQGVAAARLALAVNAWLGA